MYNETSSMPIFTIYPRTSHPLMYIYLSITVGEGTIVNRFVHLDIEGTRYRFYIMAVYLFSNGLLNTLGMFIAFQT